MIKYLGSKRRLVQAISSLASGCGASTAADLFTGTTRVAQELKRQGVNVTAVDTATYSEVLAQCYVGLDATTVVGAEASQAIAELGALPGQKGYFTEVFCERSRYLRPENGARVDAIRDAIEVRHRGSWLYPVALTSLLEAADRVDSTTGLQMAYLKQWAPRSYRPLELRVPELLAGPGRAIRADAREALASLGPVDFAYLDPPYNQHRYFTNYHVWETLIRWDAPDHYGVACKRSDSRSAATRSDFNSKATMPVALAEVVEAIDATVVVVSCNDESWLSREDLVRMCAARGHVELLEFDSKRYVGAQIGIHDPAGQKVGRVSHLRNVERLAVCGPRGNVLAAIEGWRRRSLEALEAGPLAAGSTGLGPVRL
ncbi:MAG TPA: DNA adenine methylase [Acidimicrobiales bacterium]|nr:DNA adenine methylase [Acidimicrobiales bacterium]